MPAIFYLVRKSPVFFYARFRLNQCLRGSADVPLVIQVNTSVF